MARHIEEGSRVLVIRAGDDDEEWEGVECTLKEFDQGDDRFPYLVEDDEGEDRWVREVEPVSEQAAGDPPQMSREIFQVVRQFMQGRQTSVKDVARLLPRKQAVIIKLNPNSPISGSDSNGGPYIVIWHSQCAHACKWASSDNYINESGYRFGMDGHSNMTLKTSVADRCQGYQAYLVDLNQARSLASHMRYALGLDNDLYRSGSTDSNIGHDNLLKVIQNAELATLLTEVPQQPVSADTGKSQKVSQSGESKMSNKIASIVNQAKAATVTAAEIQAGKALNIAAVKAAKSKAPMMIRGYMDHPAAPAVIALAVVSAAEFMPASPAKAKITKAANLMLTAAVIEGADKFLDLEGMIDKVFAGLPAEAKALIDA